MTRTRAAIAALLASITCTAANAGLLTVANDGNTSGFVIPGNNNYPGFPGTNGQVGALVQSNFTGTVELTFDLLFSEARLINYFDYEGDNLFETISGTHYYSDSWTLIDNLTAGSALDFAFRTAALADLTNANNGADPARTFFTYMDGDVLYLALDDSGAGPDDNHDDMIIRITARDVPEPAGLALLMAGLAGLGMARRRK